VDRRGLIVIGGAFLVVGLATVLVAPRVGNALAGAGGIHDVAALPERIQLCGRSWHKDDLERRFTLAETRELSGDPTVVDPAPWTSCAPGPCTDAAQPGACETVVWVRTGEDAYVDYALQGGP
jgi:hypothetical protein